MPSLGSDEAQSAVELGHCRILFVEDDKNTREATGLFLSTLGATVQAAESVSAALAAFDQFQPNLLLSDIAMPLEDGYSLIRKIRQRPKESGGEIIAIALTAFASKEDSQRALEAGFNAHVAKPVNDRTLANLIIKWLPEPTGS
jgi:CheY-like chemotaxis protein